jgi:large subunit ribosomal protein L6
MSRIGKVPIEVPANVKVRIQGKSVAVEGPKGKLDFTLPEEVLAELEGSILKVTRKGDHSRAKAMHGLSRSILNNLVTGVNRGYVKNLVIEGVGFKAAVKGKMITMNLGYSHPCDYNIPDQIVITVDNNTKIKIEGPSKELVGQVASDLRGFYPPEPYKGKGVRYSDEVVVRKEGKTVQ